MTTRDEAWAPGTPCWADLGIPDRKAAFAFYSAVFGWEIEEGDAEMGYYSTCRLGGRRVAAISEVSGEWDAGTYWWNTYLASTDVNATAAAVTDAGGTVVMEPMQIMEHGSMMMASDPAGAQFGVWQAGTHTGFELANETGSVTWNEQISPDFDGSKKFYEIFGYSYGDMSNGDFHYATLDLNGAAVGGIGQSGPNDPPGDAFWRVYFVVDDVDASAEAVKANGGSVISEPADTPFGRMSCVAGPAGEQFMIMVALPPADEAAAAEA